MAEGDFDRLQQRLLTDDDLLERFHKEPRAVIEEHDISLTEEEHTKVTNTLSGTTKEHIRSRIQSQGFKVTML